MASYTADDFPFHQELCASRRNCTRRGTCPGLVFLAKHLGHIWPYSLMAYGMNSNAPQELLESGYVCFVVICIVYIAIFMITSSTILSKRDI